MKYKKLLIILLGAAMVFSLMACGKEDKKEKKYSSYIENLIMVNYLGASDDYIKSTGANKSDAEAMYKSNIDRLANALRTYYGLDINDDDELYADLQKLSEKIYGNVKYSVGKAYKKNGRFLVDISIYPIDIIAATETEIKNYVADFNNRVAAGEFNNYEKEAYEHDFSEGIVEILKNASDNMKYQEPQTVTVTIIEEGDTFFISNDDLIRIDAAMIAGSTAVPEEKTSESE
ncbi:MAG: hypothetical protein K6C35_04955 [Eubacterium sp.]|nr:hypothetical protein [Eubacterium sp.]